MRTLYVLTLSLIFVCIFNSCKEKCYDKTNPDCENYDPCDGKTRINSNFRVRPGDRGFKPPEQWCDLIPCDTFNESSVRFDMPLNNPSNSAYSWQIGTELTPRTGKGFEIDFSDYLNKGKWETYIPITLTIRTPLNSCMTHPEDTLIIVTRQLFFTQNQLSLFKNGDNTAIYKGYFTNDPNKEIILTFILKNSGNFRGALAPIGLVVGVPDIDTFISPPDCDQIYCNNYKHTIGQVIDPGGCFPSANNFTSYFEFLSIDGVEKIKRIWVFNKPNGTKRFEFIGNRIN